jgi:hypothetical protein
MRFFCGFDLVQVQDFSEKWKTVKI